MANHARTAAGLASKYLSGFVHLTPQPLVWANRLSRNDAVKGAVDGVIQASRLRCRAGILARVLVAPGAAWKAA